MSNEERTQTGWRGLIPRGRVALVGVSLIAVMAFLLGGLFLGGGDAELPSADSGQEQAQAGEQGATIWTCSMHPQIQLPKPGKCPICFMDLIPVETGGGEELGPRQIRMSETAKELARIETSPVMLSTAAREIRLVGKIDYDESRLAYITAWVPGRLDKLFVDFTGAQVRQGQPLVEIYSPELISAQEELLQSLAAVKSLNRTSSSVLRSTAEETVSATRERLLLLGLTEQQLREIENSGEPAQHLTVASPLGGVVIHKDAKEGMYVTTGTRIYTIADLSHLWVQLEAYESDLPWLKVGQRLAFDSPSFPGETFKAEITFIDPTINAASRTVQVRAELQNSSGRLKPDMFVSGVIAANLADLGAFKGELLIPATAPLITGKRAVVYVELPSEDGPLYEGREIELGPRAGDFYVVKEGLAEGDQVVTNGAFKIDSELQIQAKPSMMSAPTAMKPVGTMAAGKTSDFGYKAGAAARIVVSPEALQSLKPVYHDYFGVQMALADDDLAGATASFKALVDMVNSVKMNLFEGEGHERWMQISVALIAAAEKGAKSATIADARDAFFYLSEAVIELHDTFGHAESEDFYLTFCPMARDNAGAFWLQTVDTVYNSFYGAMMLRCGEIKKPLPPVSDKMQKQSAEAVDPLTDVYHAYFDLQRALTFDVLERIDDAYRLLAEKFSDWQNGEPEAATLAGLAEQGAGAPDLATARRSFLPVAEGIIGVHERFGHTENKDYFLIYCPHATDSGGASWLQDVDTMYNSFLGGVMSTCTEEKTVLSPRTKESR